MPLPKPLTLDLWSAYDYKPAFKEMKIVPAPTWVGDEHRRRLEAYKLLTAYLENSARFYLPNDADADARREYGDASVIVSTIVDAVLGEEARVMVRGSGKREEPDTFADGLQEWFEEWSENERLFLTIMETEEDAVGLGDGVLEVAWDGEKRRPTVTSYDPGFYFPVLDPSTMREQFPLKVHLAWEYEKWLPATQSYQRYVRRITWELVEVETLDPEFYNTDLRQYPWNSEPSNLVCLKSDGTWSYENLGTRTWLDLDANLARYEVNADGRLVRDLDIGVDFIPVIHLPNTTNRREHYGRSSLQKILQILDDLQSADTDLLKTSRTTGAPPLGTESPIATNQDGVVDTYGPGQIIQGKITVVDTSKNLDALLKYVEFLLKRLSTNIRLPESVLGKLRPSEVPSGIALALSFGPLRSMVRRMRLSRSEKYPLLLKFVHRFAMLDDPALRTAEAPPIEIAFGTFLPSDRAVIISDITELHREKLISRETAIRLLIQDAGLDIVDAIDEVDAIQEEDFEGARRLSEAVESPDAAAEYLGIEIPEPAPARLAAMERESELRREEAAARGFGQNDGPPNPNGNGNAPAGAGQAG